MADKGIIAVWMDADRDRDHVVLAVQRAFPENRINFLNTRHFTGATGVGVETSKLRGYALATGMQAIHDAYKSAGLEYLDLSMSPKRERQEPECVVVYLTANDNEMNDAVRAQARRDHPAVPVRAVDAAPFNGPEVGNIVAVFVPETAAHIAEAYVNLHKVTVMVPRPSVDSAGAPRDTGHVGAIDPSVLAATLALDLPNFTGVVKGQKDVVWLTALCDMEASGEDREDVHRVLQERLLDLGSVNQHYHIGQSAPVGIGEHVEDSAESAGDDAGQAPAASTRDMSFITGKSVREALVIVDGLDDVDTLRAILESEEAGKGRKTVCKALAKRISTLDR